MESNESNEVDTWILGYLQTMDLTNIGSLVAEMWPQTGRTTDVGEPNEDGHITIRVTASSSENEKAVIQIRQKTGHEPQQKEDIEEFISFFDSETDADRGVIVTTEYFTENATQRAREANIELIDGEGLVSLIAKHDMLDEFVDLDPDPLDVDIDSKTHQQLRNHIGDGYEKQLTEQLYSVQAALIDAEAEVTLNPKDAARLGILEGINIEEDPPFEAKKVVTAIAKDDVHLTKQGEIFVEDLSQYINSAVIDAPSNKNIVGHIEQDAPDSGWVLPSIVAKLLSKIAMRAGGSSNQEPQETDADSSSEGMDGTSTSDTEGSKSNSRSEQHSSDNRSQGLTTRAKTYVKETGYFHYIAVGGLLLTIISFFIVGIYGEREPLGPVVTIFVLLLLIMPFVGLIGLVLDLWHINADDSEWDPSILLGLLAAILVWPLYSIYYVYMRVKYPRM